MAIRLRWAMTRILVLSVSLTLPLTGGLAVYIVGPLLCYFYFNDWRFWKYQKPVFRATFNAYRILYRWLTDKAYREMFEAPLTARPMSGPDERIVRLTEVWKTGAQDCNTCSRCCTEIKCPLLNRDTGRCMSYSSVFWRYFNCGRYPLSQKQISYYGCPKWELVKLES